MKTRYKHIIWDWNGTLLNDIALCIKVLNRLLEQRGRLPITQEDYRRNFRFPVIHFYKYLGMEIGKDSFEQISREFIDNYESHCFQECSLQPGANDVLTQLAKHGITHSALSAAKQDALELGIQHFGIRDHFIGLSGASDIHAKGKIQQGLNWIQQLDWNPNDIVLIGDTDHDYEVSLAMGTDCILTARGHHAYERLAKTGARVINSLEELVPLVHCKV